MAKYPFRQLDIIRKASLKGKRINDCYRLMYHKDLWIEAYNRILQKGRNPLNHPPKHNIPSSISHQIDITIQQLRLGTYRRSTIKWNGSKGNLQTNKPHTIFSWDIIVQEVVCIILENVYEPIFEVKCNRQHVFKDKHIALKHIKSKWNGLTWGIQGDLSKIIGSFNNNFFLTCVAKKIEDHRFLLFIHQLLKGVNEKESPLYIFYKNHWATSIFISIYLHELDLFIMKLSQEIYIGRCGFGYEKKDETNSITNDRKNVVNPFIIKNLHSNWQSVTKVNFYNLYKKNVWQKPFCQQQVPRVSSHIHYVRFGAQFILGVSCRKKSVLFMMENIQLFLKYMYQYEVKREQLKLSHLRNPMLFLGYHIRYVPVKKPTLEPLHVTRQHMVTKHFSNQISLEIPKVEMIKIAKKNGYGDLIRFSIYQRPQLLNFQECTILYMYNNELKNIAKYYRFAKNKYYLRKLFYLAEKSFIKTLASKRRCSTLKVTKSLKRYKQGSLTLIERTPSGKVNVHQFIRFKDTLGTFK